MIIHSIIAAASQTDSTTWPDLILYCVVAICITSFFLGNWPWQKG
jgi:hypothetical protein